MPVGESTMWKPTPAANVTLGCTRHLFAGGLVLVLMRDVAEKHMAIARRVHDAALEANARLVSSIARQVRAPLSKLRAADEAPASEVRSVARDLQRVVDGALDFVRVGPPAVWNVSLKEAIANSIEDAHAEFPSRPRHVRVTIDDHAVWGRGNPLTIEQILTELIVNALQSGGSETQIEITATSRRDGPMDQVDVVIEDDGPGVAPELQDRVFEPFFTTKQTGTGLGLTTAREAANDLGGDLRLERGARGARFVLSLGAGEASRR
ncbi:hypothetical protein BH09MYX1_BH09MYX1_28390 [soil metagenome]